MFKLIKGDNLNIVLPSELSFLSALRLCHRVYSRKGGLGDSPKSLKDPPPPNFKKEWGYFYIDKEEKILKFKQNDCYSMKIPPP